MAKGMFLSFMPLYSIQAWGRYYGTYPFGSWNQNIPGHKDYAIYQRRRTLHGIICIKERYYKSSNPFHPYCVIGQNKLAAGVSYWQGLTTVEKKIYNSYTYPTRMSGYNRFLHYYLKNLPY